MDFVPLILLWLSLTMRFLQQRGWMFSFDKRPDVFSSLREVTESWAGYLTANLMALGLLRRFLILWVFPWPVGTVNSCLCLTTSGPGPDAETEACALQNCHCGVWSTGEFEWGKDWSVPVLLCSTRHFARSYKRCFKVRKLQHLLMKKTWGTGWTQEKAVHSLLVKEKRVKTRE